MYSFAFSLNGTTDLQSAFCSTTLADQQYPATLCIYLSTREPNMQQTAPWLQMPAWCQQTERQTVHIKVCKPHFQYMELGCKFSLSFTYSRGTQLPWPNNCGQLSNTASLQSTEFITSLRKHKKNWIKCNFHYIDNGLFFKMFPLNCYLSTTHCKSEVVWFHLHLKWFL